MNNEYIELNDAGWRFLLIFTTDTWKWIKCLAEDVLEVVNHVDEKTRSLAAKSILYLICVLRKNI